MNILDILSPEAIKVPLAATHKQAAIDELIDLLAARGIVTDAPSLKRAVWEREQQRSTGIGEGLASPHGKSSSARALTMAIGKPAQPLEFGSIDRKPVQMIILLVSPADKIAEHIQALGRVSKLMTNVQFRGACYAATSADEVYGLFRAAENPAAAAASRGA
jgi:mannitol/fructose-specific phosphotransferase system IIA component (Ntr-type)